MKKPKKIVLAQFNWHGLNKNGKRIEGELKAKNLAAARSELRRQGINVKKITKQSQLWKNLNKKNIVPADIATFSRQLATMIASGIPLVQGLDIVAKGSDNPTISDLINTIKAQVESGSTLAEAFAKHPKQFDGLFCSLIEAGEQSGTLDVMLDRIATYREKTESMKKKIRKALTYPAAVIVVAFVVTTILLVKVIPQFETLFKSVGGNLPAFTQFVVDLSKIFQAYWWMIAGGAVLAIIAFVLARQRNERFHYLTDAASLHIPIFGSLLQKAAIARFCRTLATTFAAGMPLLTALTISSKAAGNKVFEKAILSMRDNIASGEQFHASMNMTRRFPNMIIQMASIGEESGELDAMMNKAASVYEEDVDTMVDGLSSLIEPMIMAILGVLVGGLVIAMYLPIFEMGKAV